MKTNLLIRLLPIAFTAACTSVSSPSSDDTFSLPDIPDSPQKASVPYPKLDEQTQIDHLGVQVARIEREMEAVNLRLQQIEQQNKIHSRPAKKTVSQRLDDQKLKKHYLENGGTAPTETDSLTLSETRLYERASKYYRNGNYRAAAAILKEADGGSGSDIARRNMYLLLQSQQRMGHCESVIEIGGRYANRFRSSPQAPDALFSIGQCQYQLQQKDIARNTWRKLIQSYPDSEAAKRAAISIKQR